MPYNKIITSDLAIQALYANKGIFNKVNRNYDGYLAESRGANQISIPKLPKLVAVTPPAANRKNMVGDTTMVNVTMKKSVVEIAQEVEMKFVNKSGRILQGFIDGMSKAHGENFDAAVITEAQAGGTVINWEGANPGYDDIAAIIAQFDIFNVPDDGERMIFYHPTVGLQLIKDPVLARAASFNPNYLENGIFKVLNTTLIKSSLVGKVNGKDNLLGVWGPGVAFLQDELMDQEEVWDSVNKVKDIDYLVWYGAKLFDAQFAIVNSAN